MTLVGTTNYPWDLAVSYWGRTRPIYIGITEDEQVRKKMLMQEAGVGKHYLTSKEWLKVAADTVGMYMCRSSKFVIKKLTFLCRFFRKGYQLACGGG